MSQSTPAPDTTARTETAETVTVPRAVARKHAVELEQCSIFAADVGPSIAKAMTDCAADLRAALASAKHPVGVREALEKLRGYIVNFEAENDHDLKFPGWLAVIDHALSHPPAQDAPGAEINALRAENEAYRDAARSMLNNWRFGDFFKPQQPEPLYVRKFAELHRASAERLAAPPIVRTRETGADLRLDGIDEYGPLLGWFRPWTSFPIGTEFAALDPSPPPPEADGEVVAELRAALERYDQRPDYNVTQRVIAAARASQSALVSAREREATTAAEADHWKRKFDASEAAREKAEQVAAGLWEIAGDLAGIVKTQNGNLYPEINDLLSRAAAALRASTEEGKTATPSVKDEEAGRG